MMIILNTEKHMWIQTHTTQWNPDQWSPWWETPCEYRHTPCSKTLINNHPDEKPHVDTHTPRSKTLINNHPDESPHVDTHTPRSKTLINNHPDEKPHVNTDTHHTVKPWSIITLMRVPLLPPPFLRPPFLRPLLSYFHVSEPLTKGHSSGAVWESRWPSWAVRPNEPSGFCGRKAILNHTSALVTVCP